MESVKDGQHFGGVNFVLGQSPSVSSRLDNVPVPTVDPLGFIGRSVASVAAGLWRGTVPVTGQ